MRGKLVTVNNLFITGGQAMAGVVDGAFGGMEKSGWR
jgi:SP family myo-inositol transporter-like MFS transporter 13